MLKNKIYRYFTRIFVHEPSCIRCEAWEERTRARAWTAALTSGLLGWMLLTTSSKYDLARVEGTVPAFNLEKSASFRSKPILPLSSSVARSAILVSYLISVRNKLTTEQGKHGAPYPPYRFHTGSTRIFVFESHKKGDLMLIIADPPYMLDFSFVFCCVLVWKGEVSNTWITV